MKRHNIVRIDRIYLTWKYGKSLKHLVFQCTLRAFSFAIFNVRPEMRFQSRIYQNYFSCFFLCLFSRDVIYCAPEVREKRVSISGSGVKDARDHHHNWRVFALWRTRFRGSHMYAECKSGFRELRHDARMTID